MRRLKPILFFAPFLVLFGLIVEHYVSIEIGRKSTIIYAREYLRNFNRKEYPDHYYYPKASQEEVRALLKRLDFPDKGVHGRSIGVDNIRSKNGKVYFTVIGDSYRCYQQSARYMRDGDIVSKAPSLPYSGLGPGSSCY